MQEATDFKPQDTFSTWTLQGWIKPAAAADFPSG